jgi:hypothetical protein
VPEVVTLINKTVEYENEAKKDNKSKEKAPLINIFAEVSPSKSIKKRLMQTAISLHPGHHVNLNMKIKELELKESGQKKVQTQSGRSVLVPGKYLKR